MEKNLSKKISLIALLFIASISIGIQQPIKTDSQALTACDKPLIYEYISNFTLPLQDVKAVSSNQLSKNSINNIAATKVDIYNIVYQSSMGDSSQSQSDGPFQADAINENLRFRVTYQMNVSHLTGKNQYNATTDISGIVINYHKAFDSSLGKSVISKVAFKFQPSMMRTSINPAPKSKNDSNHIGEALNATTGSSLYLSIKAILNPLEQYMNQNIKTEHLSKIFQSNPYSYDYYNYKIDVDTSSNSVTVAQGSDVINGISATIKDSTHCSTFVPTFQNGNTFYTFEFIQNMAQYTLKTYPPYQSVTIDKTTIRTNVFQFKLIDLQYVLDNFLDDLGQYYLNEIYFTCKMQDIVDANIDSQNKNIIFAVDWKCACYVKNATGGLDVQVMDFVPRMKHLLQMRASDTMSVYVNKIDTIDVTFNTVANYNVINQKLFKMYMTEVFNEMRTYTIGTFFSLKKGSSKIVFGDNNSGIWVA